MSNTISSLTGFYHYTVLCNGNPDKKGRVTAFYVVRHIPNEDHKGYDFEVFTSFSFCSPDDVRIGKFSKSEGRRKALNRFYGIDGEQTKRLQIHGFNLDGVFKTIERYLRSLFEGDFMREVDVSYDLEDGEVRRVIDFAPEYIVGTIKIPNWIVNDKNQIEVEDNNTSQSVQWRYGWAVPADQKDILSRQFSDSEGYDK